VSLKPEYRSPRREGARGPGPRLETWATKVILHLEGLLSPENPPKQAAGPGGEGRCGQSAAPFAEAPRDKGEETIGPRIFLIGKALVAQVVNLCFL
jgi:hypothetical protein